MIETLITLLLFAFAGAVVGLIIGLTGVGGGSLMTPLLTLLFSVPSSVAVGTDLVFAALTKGVGTLAHRLHGTVRWDIVIRLCLGSIPSAGCTLALMHIWGPISTAWEVKIKIAVGISVLLTALSLILRKSVLTFALKHPLFDHRPKLRTYTTIGVGIVIGALVTISSIGAGAIGATLIVLLYPRLRVAEISGTDIAHAVPLTAIAGLGHWWLGHVDVLLLLGLLCGSLPAIWIGAQLAKRFPEALMRTLLILILSSVGIKLVF